MFVYRYKISVRTIKSNETISCKRIVALTMRYATSVVNDNCVSTFHNSHTRRPLFIQWIPVPSKNNLRHLIRTCLRFCSHVTPFSDLKCHDRYNDDPAINMKAGCIRSHMCNPCQGWCSNKKSIASLYNSAVPKSRKDWYRRQLSPPRKIITRPRITSSETTRSLGRFALLSIVHLV